MAYENIKLKDTQPAAMHRSSSCSTMTANGTSLNSKPVDERDKAPSQCSTSVLEFPGQNCLQGSSLQPRDEEVRNQHGPGRSSNPLPKSAHNRLNQLQVDLASSSV